MDNTTGKKTLFRDAKWGNLTNGVLGFAALWAASSIGDVDFTPLPDVLEAFVVPAATTAVGLLVSWGTAHTARSRQATAPRGFDAR